MNRNRLKRPVLQVSTVNPTSPGSRVIPASSSLTVTVNLFKLDPTINHNDVKDNRFGVLPGGTVSPTCVCKSKNTKRSSEIVINSFAVKTNGTVSHSAAHSNVVDTFAQIQPPLYTCSICINKDVQLELKGIKSHVGGDLSSTDAPAVEIGVEQSSAVICTSSLEASCVTINELCDRSLSGNDAISTVPDCAPSLCSLPLKSANMRHVDDCELQKVENLNALTDVTDSVSHESFLDDAGVDVAADSVCQICRKDLRKWNSQRRLQHINHCIDEVCKLLSLV